MFAGLSENRSDKAEGSYGRIYTRGEKPDRISPESLRLHSMQAPIEIYQAQDDCIVRVGIVGSRTFPQLKLVEWFVRDMPQGVTIVSGGAKGVDAAAAEYARQRGLEVIEYQPDLSGCTERYEYTQRYFDRNQRIVNDCDLLVAFTEKENGGTWDTIKRAQRAGKPLKIIKPAVFFTGEAEPEDEQSEEKEISPQQAARDANRGHGPFAIKRVSLGSYALRRKCYISPEEWAEIVVDKDSNPDRLAAKMVPSFLEYFEKNNRLGFIHAVTVPPRSKRNADKPHVMDIVSQDVAHRLGVEWVRMFEPWEKTSRGRHAKHGEIQIRPEVSRLIGKVVWVLDDVTTTNFTLRAAVQSLISLEVHAHGLAYVLMG